MSIQYVQARDLKRGAKKPVGRDATGLGLNVKRAPTVPGADSGADPDAAALREVGWTLESVEPCDGQDGRYLRPGDYELQWRGESNDPEVNTDSVRKEIRNGQDLVIVATGGESKPRDLADKAEEFGVPVPARADDEA